MCVGVGVGVCFTCACPPRMPLGKAMSSSWWPAPTDIQCRYQTELCMVMEHFLIQKVSVHQDGTNTHTHTHTHTHTCTHTHTHTHAHMHTHTHTLPQHTPALIPPSPYHVDFSLLFCFHCTFLTSFLLALSSCHTHLCHSHHHPLPCSILHSGCSSTSST